MSLRSRFSRAAREFFKTEETTATETAKQQAALSRDQVMLNTDYKSETDRRAAVEFSRRMYAQDTRAEAIINTLSGDATFNGFTLVSKDARAKEIADALIKRIDLTGNVDDYTRDTFKDGDSFFEIGVNVDGLITEVSRKPTLSMHRDSNDQDKFDDPARAYWLSTSPITTVTGKPGRDALWFAQWQIVHARWAHTSERRYGKPLLQSAISAYKIMTDGETSVAVRRKTRAGIRYLHVVEGGDETAIEKYKQVNKDAINNPNAAIVDFFVNTVNGVTAITGDTGIGEIRDILHHISTFFVGAPTPMSLLGYGEMLNRDVLDAQRDQYDRALIPVTDWVTKDIVKPLIEIQWRLLGLFPPNIDYKIKWSPKRPLTPAQVIAGLDAVLKAMQIGIAEDGIRQLLALFLPGIEVGKLNPLDIALAGLGALGEGDDARRLFEILQKIGLELEQ